MTSLDSQTHPDPGAGPRLTLQPATFDNGRRCRFNAWFFSAFDRYIPHIASRHKQYAFGNIEPGTIVEVGAEIRHPWSWVYEGCDTCRDTVSTIEAAGFIEVQWSRRRLRHSFFFSVNSAIHGIAIS